jgi:DnaJ-class molecular chaperone
MTLHALLASATTTLVPAPAAPGAGNGFNASIALGLTLYLVAYVASLRLFPLRRCRACRGYGRVRGAFVPRICRRCDGTGRTFRLGARLVARNPR